MIMNLTSTERIAAVILGMGLIAFTAVYLGVTEVFAYRAFCIAFALLGVDMLVTGALGFCPLYYKLGRKSLVAVTRQPR